MTAKRPLWLLLAAALLAGCVEAPPQKPEAPRQPSPVETPAPGSKGEAARGPVKTDPAINTMLLDVFQNMDKEKVDLTAAQGTPLGDLLTLGSPVGYDLRNRYLQIGIPVLEALSRDYDPDVRAKLVEMARWERNAEVRAAALIAVARSQDARDLPILNEALVNVDPAVRFGALEALTVYGHPELSLPLLTAASQRDYEPVLRVYAAAGVAKLGDTTGLHRLRAFLDDPSWLVRAMAARYLGDYGTAEDYDLLVGRIGREQSNDFTVAEVCIGAIKMYPKKKAAVAAAEAAKPTAAPPPASRGNNPEPQSEFEDDTLVITAPTVKVKKELLDPQIYATLLRLLQQRMNARPGALESSDPSLQNLSKLTTLTGYNLKTRYTELGFLLTEGLAGVTDYQLAKELENVAKLGTNVQTRAAAMVALAYTHDMQYLSLFQNGQQDPNITVRFGALESLLTLDNPATVFQVSNMARTDLNIIIQLYAAAGAWKMGDVFGREILIRHYQDNDWFVRAMATHYLGELGGADEYRRLFSQINFEQNPQVKAELSAALLRLQRFKED